MLAWHQYIIGMVFILAGMYHFKKPKLYLKIMPPYLPIKSSLVLITGILEMVLGMMILSPATQTIAGWGIIVLLVLFLPVHIYMLQNEEASLKLPKWVLIIRIPLQFGLMYWAYQYV